MIKTRQLVLFIFLVLFSLPAFSDVKISFYEKELKRKDLPDSTRIEYYKILFDVYIKFNDDTALEYGKMLLDFTKENSLKIDEEFEFRYGKSLIEFGYFNDGLKYTNYLHKKYKSKSDYLNMLKAEGLTALLYYKKGYISKSIYQYENNIKAALKYEFYDYAAKTLYSLSNICRDIGETDDEFKNLLESFKYYSKSKEENTKNLLFILHRLGNLYYDKKKFPEALKKFNEGIKIAKSVNDTTWVLRNNINIAHTYYGMGHSDTSLAIYKEIIPLCILMRDSSSLASSYGYIGDILYEKKKTSNALSYYSKAIDIATTRNDIYNLAWLYKSLSKIYENKEDFKMAYKYHLKHAEYQQNLMQSEYIKKMGQANLLYISGKKEKELELLSARLNKNRLLTYGLGLGIVLFVIVGGLIFRQSRQTNLRRLSEMNHKISEVTQKNLRQQMNPHFIFNTLNSIQYYMYQNDRISTNNYLTKFSSLMRKTLENSTHTSIPINDEIEALQLYLQLEALRFKDKFKWEINIDEEIDPLLFKIPTMLIQPYVENSICHGLSNKDDNGYIHIDLKLFENYISVTIEDDGIGREKAQQIKKIKNGKHSSLGTKITESRLKLVNDLYGNEMKIHYEDLKDDHGMPAGTRVIINIPIIS